MTQPVCSATGEGFDYAEPSGATTIAACASKESIFISSEYDRDDFSNQIGVELPKEKAVEFARWILAQCAAPEITPKRDRSLANATFGQKDGQYGFICTQCTSLVDCVFGGGLCKTCSDAADAAESASIPSATTCTPGKEALILAAKVVTKKGEFADMYTASTAALLLATEILTLAYPNGVPQ